MAAGEKNLAFEFSNADHSYHTNVKMAGNYGFGGRGGDVHQTPASLDTAPNFYGMPGKGLTPELFLRRMDEDYQKFCPFNPDPAQHAAQHESFMGHLRKRFDGDAAAWFYDTITSVDRPGLNAARVNTDWPYFKEIFQRQWFTSTSEKDAVIDFSDLKKPSWMAPGRFFARSYDTIRKNNVLVSQAIERRLADPLGGRGGTTRRIALVRDLLVIFDRNNIHGMPAAPAVRALLVALVQAVDNPGIPVHIPAMIWNREAAFVLLALCQASARTALAAYDTTLSHRQACFFVSRALGGHLERFIAQHESEYLGNPQAMEEALDEQFNGNKYAYRTQTEQRQLRPGAGKIFAVECEDDLYADTHPDNEDGDAEIAAFGAGGRGRGGRGRGRGGRGRGGTARPPAGGQANNAGIKCAFCQFGHSAQECNKLKQLTAAWGHDFKINAQGHVQPNEKKKQNKAQAFFDSKKRSVVKASAVEGPQSEPAQPQQQQQAPKVTNRMVINELSNKVAALQQQLERGQAYREPAYPAGN